MGVGRKGKEIKEKKLGAKEGRQGWAEKDKRWWRRVGMEKEGWDRGVERKGGGREGSREVDMV